ncbi:MAG: flavodoxin-dependent (E)-4-hydroxy-3-methylbut-2-enyl-diphosphate synthase [Candidatus Omnitrophica bacterium]|nr:flavodoxin-dependent (E)-4-hydroxy-3-methylbut-2-enyl-diphosphate synthase [Candidatus Omnitrophota bacterium]
MIQSIRRKTPTVKIGNILLGSSHSIVIQSMTNTPTADVDKTLSQVFELIESGSQLVRLTVNDDDSAKAIPEIVKSLRKKGIETPIIGDFHFNGHILLNQYPQCAESLDKYRINPGNIGKGQTHDNNFENFIKVAIKHNKPVRIGVNWGSLDQELLAELMSQSSERTEADNKNVIIEAMIKSALQSAQYAEKIGLRKDQIVLSVKMSLLQDMVNVYSRLAKECDYALHLGLTEAGGDIEGLISSSAALAILLHQGIGDTIRISLTPEPGAKRSLEVEACKTLLQSMGLQHFRPSVISCPGCGRTDTNLYQELAKDIKNHINKNLPVWKQNFPGVETLTIAVMGCVVNGPGESKHADIGISLPGKREEQSAPVFANGKIFSILKGNNIKDGFIAILEEYISKKFSSN